MSHLSRSCWGCEQFVKTTPESGLCSYHEKHVDESYRCKEFVKSPYVTEVLEE